jgi:hypothetical protein
MDVYDKLRAAETPEDFAANLRVLSNAMWARCDLQHGAAGGWRVLAKSLERIGRDAPATLNFRFPLGRQHANRSR